MSKAAVSFAWADRLRNVATLMVIIIHVAGAVAEQVREYESTWWWGGNLWDSLSRPAVPLFVMLSGYLLLSKDYPLPDFLKRRFTRVLIPALFWMGVYSLYNHFAKNDPADLQQALSNIIKGPVHYHLWFIYLIIGLYVLYPILRPWVKQATDRDFWYFFVLWALGTWVYKICYQFFNQPIGLYIELFTNQAGFFVLGYYLGTKPLQGEAVAGLKPWGFSHRKMVWLAATLLLTGFISTAVGTYWASKTFGGQFHSFFYDYLTPNCTLAAAGWFLLARYTWNKPAITDFEKEFATASFGIYFIHVLVMDWWSVSGYWQSKYHPAICAPAVSIMVALTAFLVIGLIRALPGGTRIT